MFGLSAAIKMRSDPGNILHTVNRDAFRRDARAMRLRGKGTRWR